MIRRFWTDHSAATAIEYGLIAGLISLLIIAGVTTISTNLRTRYFAPIAANLS